MKTQPEYDAGGYCQNYSIGTMIPASQCTEVMSGIMNEPGTSSRLIMSNKSREVPPFVNNRNQHGPAHHCAVGVGHISSKIQKLGALLEMDVVKVC